MEPNKFKSPTIGESRVRTSFNTANSDKVTEIKNKSAELIDMMEEFKEYEVLRVTGTDLDADKERMRVIEIAQTNYESAAMWAVKAATAYL